MSIKLNKKGNFYDSLNAQVLGSLFIGGNKSIDIYISTSQLIPTAPLPTYILNIYTHSESYKKDFNGVSNNLNQMKILESIKITCSDNSDSDGKNNYSNSLAVNCEYITFVIDSSSVNDLEFVFRAHVNDNFINNYVVRDQNLELDERALITRNVSDFKTECIAGQQRGITSWNMNLKGEITNTELLLNNNSTISTLGFFNTLNEQHTTNIIKIISDSANDNLTGLGGQIIQITGLDNNFNQIQENINLNGISVVSSVNSYTEVNYAKIIKSGALHSNAGNIIIYNDFANGGGSGNPQNSISSLYGIHQNPQYCVPRGYKLFITKLFINFYCEDECELYINVYDWIDPGVIYSNINKKRINVINLLGNSSLECDLNFLINERQRFTITSQVLTTPTGINKISVNVDGYLKLNKMTQHSQYNRDVGIKYVEGFDTLPIDLPTDY